jgi:hypothetical protein
MTVIAAIVISVFAIYWMLRSPDRGRDQERRATQNRRAQSDRRSGNRRKAQGATDTAQVTSRYRAASIFASRCACDAVKLVEGKRYLAAQAPKLPLQDCSAERCACRYVRHEDRRSSQGDRRALYSLQTDLYGADGQPDRRSRGGRRRADREGELGDAYGLNDLKWNT